MARRSSWRRSSPSSTRSCRRFWPRCALPFTALLGFLLVLALDAGMLLLADHYSDGLKIDSFWAALGVALVAAAVGVVLSVVFGTNDDDAYSLRVVQRIAALERRGS